MESGFALGVDIGGSHIVAALVDTDTGIILSHTQYRAFVNSGGNATEIIHDWAAAIKQSWTLAGIKTAPIGIAMPGPFDYDKGICLIAKQEKYKALYSMNVKELLAEELGLQPTEVRFINDASAFLKGELIAGSLWGLDNAVGITLGTGLGSAYFKNNQLTDAALWKMPFKSGIAEDYLSTRWFVNEYKYRYNKVIKGVKELVETGEKNDEAVTLFESFAVNLADFVQLLRTSLQCNNIVVGGNITRAASYFWEHTRKLLQQNRCPAKLSVAKLGEMAAIIGAATLFEKEKITKI